jgi:hypothetical protein
VTFDLENGPVRLTAITGGTADEFYILMAFKENNGWRKSLTIRIRDDFWITIWFKVGQPRKGRSKVDANVFSHNKYKGER